MSGRQELRVPGDQASDGPRGSGAHKQAETGSLPRTCVTYTPHRDSPMVTCGHDPRCHLGDTDGDSLPLGCHDDNLQHKRGQVGCLQKPEDTFEEGEGLPSSLLYTVPFNASPILIPDSLGTIVISPPYLVIDVYPALKPQEPRDHELGPVTDGIDGRVLNHHTLEIGQEDLERHDHTAEVRLRGTAARRYGGEDDRGQSQF